MGHVLPSPFCPILVDLFVVRLLLVTANPRFVRVSHVNKNYYSILIAAKKKIHILLFHFLLMDLELELSANMWNLDASWQNQVCDHERANVDSVPRLLGFCDPSYLITFSPQDTSKIEDLKTVHIEVVRKIAKVSLSPMFCAFTDAVYRSQDCCFCVGQDICVDCQVKREEEKLKKQIKGPLDYLDLSVHCSTIPELYDVVPLNISPSTALSLPRVIRRAAFERTVQQLRECNVGYYSFACLFLTVSYSKIKKKIDDRAERRLPERATSSISSREPDEKIAEKLSDEGGSSKHDDEVRGSIAAFGEQRHASDVEPSLVPKGKKSFVTEYISFSPRSLFNCSRNDASPTPTSLNANEFECKLRQEMLELMSDFNTRTEAKIHALSESVTELKFENKKLKHENEELKHENENFKKRLERTEANRQKAIEVALQSLDQVKRVTKENSHLKKTTQQLATQLAAQNSLDDNINFRCFFDSYLAFKGY